MSTITLAPHVWFLQGGWADKGLSSINGSPSEINPIKAPEELRETRFSALIKTKIELFGLNSSYPYILFFGVSDSHLSNYYLYGEEWWWGGVVFQWIGKED